MLPLGLAYVAGSIREAGFKVHIVDAVGEGPDTHTNYCKGYLIGLRFEQIVERIPSNTDIIGITVLFTHEWPAMVELLDQIKGRFPQVPIIIGGEHVTSLPEFSLLTSKADIAVLGEGEETSVEVVRALREGQDLTSVRGIAFRRGGRVIVNPRRDRTVNVDSIPTPAWDLFALRTYYEHRFEGSMHTSSMTIPMLATRGCPYQCTYCSAPNMWLPKWVPRDPIKVVDELEMYVKQYGAGNFPFQDLTAVVRKDWIKAFCEEIIRRNLKIQWQLPTGTRSEAIDSEIAHLLKASGMITMSYAPESGSDQTRILIKKKMTAENLFASIDAAAEAGLHVSIFTVIGFPHDKVEHLRENLPFIDQLAWRGAGDLNVTYYMALPGTELFRSLYDAGRITFDGKYFRHILDGLALMPATSYCNFSRLRLTYWKFKMTHRFYSAPRREAAGLIRTAFRALGGLFDKGEHHTRLETAFRHGVWAGIQTLQAFLLPRYMSKAKERRMFASWDGIYRRIHEQKLECGAVQLQPADTTELHRKNVVPALIKEHTTARTIEAF